MSDNIDPEEIQKFEDMARRWWDPSSEFKPLHAINPLRMGYIADRAAIAGKRALDIGCGGGLLTEALAAAGAETTGIDMGAIPLQVAKLHRHESGLEIDYQMSTAEQFAHTHAGEFDVVTCLEMLEHVPDPGSVIRACARLLKPGGDLFVSIEIPRAMPLRLSALNTYWVSCPAVPTTIRSLFDPRSLPRAFETTVFLYKISRV
jgi:2-polyprenyl-6-hydroxyphenyl methylase/3-demethylubiquinone-9 3-methyltransferase